MTVHRADIDMTWQRHINECPSDTVSRKLAQAEALASLLSGDPGEEFRSLNDVIQDNVMWLMNDLLTEIREAYEAREEEIKKAREVTA